MALDLLEVSLLDAPSLSLLSGEAVSFDPATPTNEHQIKKRILNRFSPKYEVTT